MDAVNYTVNNNEYINVHDIMNGVVSIQDSTIKYLALFSRDLPKKAKAIQKILNQRPDVYVVFKIHDIDVARLLRLDIDRLAPYVRGSDINIGHAFFDGYGSSIQSIDFTHLRGVTEIGWWFCRDCYRLKSADLVPLARVRKIGFGFFSGCASLEFIVLSSLKDVKFIDDHFLNGCLQLKRIRLGTNTNPVLLDAVAKFVRSSKNNIEIVVDRKIKDDVTKFFESQRINNVSVIIERLSTSSLSTFFLSRSSRSGSKESLTSGVDSNVSSRISRIEGLTPYPVKRDGHCLYRAVTYYLENGEDVQLLRNLVAARLEYDIENGNDGDRYWEAIELPPGRTIKDYIADIRSTNAWAGDLEITVLMRVLGRPIVAIDAKGTRIINRINIDALQLQGKLTGEAIFIHYNNEDHYDAFFLNGRRTPDEILTSLTPKESLSSEVDSSVSSRISPVKGLISHRVEGDGHCLYRAVSYYLGNCGDIQLLRNLVAARLEYDIENGNDGDRYWEAIELPPGRTIHDYIADIYDNGWADDLEINVLMRVLDRPIVVVNAEGTMIINRINIDALQLAGKLTGEPIFVHYVNYNHENDKDCNHYDAFFLDGRRTPDEILDALTPVEEHHQNNAPLPVPTA